MKMLTHAHSGLRWVLLALLIFAIINAFMKWRGGNEFTEKDRKLNLFTLIFAHIQLILGAALYFTSGKVQFAGESMKDSILRFFLVEHPMMMVLAIVMITIGYSKSKRTEGATAKFKTAFIFYGLGLLLLLAGIPWPFRDLGAGWF